MVHDVMTAADQVAPDHEVVIIGAGLGGLAAALRLKRAGIADFVIVEQDHAVGGTWRVNNYPGIAVDVPSFSYQLASDLNPDWSRVFAGGSEILAYTADLVERYDLGRHLRFGRAVTRLTFDETHHLWHVTLERSALRARFVINATGGLTQPKLPDIEGIEDFAGKSIHTARWDAGHDLSGQRVAVIGTGATAVQLVPALAPLVSHLAVFQRTPIWVLPKLDIGLEPFRPALRHVPSLQRALRFSCSASTEVLMLGSSYNRQLPMMTRLVELAGKAFLRTQVHDRWTREQLTPRYGFGCKRPSLSNTYLRTFNRPNTELVVDPIQRITPRGIRTTDGIDHEIDTLIFATGYLTTEPENLPPIPVIGRDGKNLGDYWQKERFQAYEGVTVPGFPNFFLSFGPYAVAGLSILAALENGARHAERAISEARRRHATCVEVRQEPHDAFFRLVLRRQRNAIFFNNGCDGSNSYYFDAHGDAPLLRPGGSLDAWWRSHRYDLDHYRYTSRPT
jgi:cation diffusion facilitator CzcD-associated flavoprotein CzcO